MTRSDDVSPGIGLSPIEALARSNSRAEGGDQQVDLGGEVAVERAEGDVRLLGDRAHLDGVEPALGGQGDRGVEDPLPAVTLSGGPEILDRQRVRAAHVGPSRR